MNWMGSTIFCLLICDMWKCVSFQYCNALVMNLISMCCSLTLQNNHQHLFYAAQVTWNSLRPVQQISSTASFKYYLNFSTPVGLICLLIHFIFVYLIFYFNTCFCFFFASFLFCFFLQANFRIWYWQSFDYSEYFPICSIVVFIITCTTELNPQMRGWLTVIVCIVCCNFVEYVIKSEQWLTETYM